MIKNSPCRITEMNHCQPSKHGHPMSLVTAIDLFTGKEYKKVIPGHVRVDVPIVTREEYLVLDVDGGYLSLWDREKGQPKDDVKVPEGEVGKKVMEMWKKGENDIWITVLGAMGMETVDGATKAERE